MSAGTVAAHGAPPEPMSARLRGIGAVAGPWLILVAVLATLWPAALGGSTDFTIVSGQSMEPTFHTGDLIITKRRSHYRVGEVIVYKIPDGSGAGREVVHRLNNVLPDGKLQAKGDNNRTGDPWSITPGDINGAKWLMIPKGGLVLGFMRSIVGLAILLGVLVTWVAWPHGEDDEAPASVSNPVPTPVVVGGRSKLLPKVARPWSLKPDRAPASRPSSRPAGTSVLARLRAGREIRAGPGHGGPVALLPRAAGILTSIERRPCRPLRRWHGGFVAHHAAA